MSVSLRAGLEERNGHQGGDPAKLAEAIARLANETRPPLRLVAGSIAFNAADAKLDGMHTELDQWRELSISTDGNYDDVVVPRY